MICTTYKNIFNISLILICTHTCLIFIYHSTIEKIYKSNYLQNTIDIYFNWRQFIYFICRINYGLGEESNICQYVYTIIVIDCIAVNELTIIWFLYIGN